MTRSQTPTAPQTPQLPQTSPPARGARTFRARAAHARTARVLLPLTAALLACAAPLLAAPAAAAAASPAEAAAPDRDRAHPPSRKAIDRYVHSYMAETDLPGATVTVTKNGRTLHAAGYGHTADGDTMTAHTQVPIASMSKSFTAVAVMQLVDDGKVDLDQPVRQYVPDFRMADPRAKRITVRQVLNQTSGMADSTHPEFRLPPAHSLADSVSRLRSSRLAASPGTAMNYHNPNYVLAARVVEVVSGQSYADYLTRHVLRPLGMTHTRTVRTTDDMPEHARGYVRAFGTLTARDHPRLFTAGAYDVVATAADLGRWLAMQNNHGRTPQGRQLVSARSLAITHTPPKGRGAPEGDLYAMGWSRHPGSGPRRIEHSGELMTQNTLHTLLPDSGYGIAVTSNTAMNSGDDSVNLVDGLVDLVQGKRPEIAKPFTSTADPVLAGLSLLALLLGAIGVRRAPAWSRRVRARPLWRAALRLLPYTVPAVLLVTAADLFGMLSNRVFTLWQLTYMWPALVVWLTVNALAATTVLAVRITAMSRAHAGAAGSGARAAHMRPDVSSSTRV